jgi:hypothetical protein
MGDIVKVFASIVALAVVATVVTNGKKTATVISATFKGFADSLTAAEGGK